MFKKVFLIKKIVCYGWNKNLFKSLNFKRKAVKTILIVDTVGMNIINVEMGPDPSQPENTFDLQQMRGWPGFDLGYFLFQSHGIVFKPKGKKLKIWDF